MNDGPVVFGRARVTVGVALGFTLLGIAALIVGWIIEPADTFYAYLVAYNYVMSTVLGALIFLMIVHAMRAGWPVLVRRLVEGVVGTLPLLALLYIPILCGLKILYPWLRPGTIPDLHERQLVAAKAAYLNVGWFVGRAVVYLAFWIFIAEMLRWWSRVKDRDPAAPVEGKMYALSGALLPVVALAVSFAAFDWLMSITPTWYSSMYPIYYFAGGFVASIALLTTLAFAADRTGAIATLRASHYYALGRLLLAFVIFWAYVAYFQFMLIWIGNKPDEVTFYADRGRGGWIVMSVILVLAQFVVPFFALLGYRIKRRGAPLTAAAIWVLCAHYIDVHWLVMPTARPRGPVYSWVDFGALFAVGGATLAFGLLRARGLHTVPIHDPRLVQALRYDSR